MRRLLLALLLSVSVIAGCAPATAPAALATPTMPVAVPADVGAHQPGTSLPPATLVPRATAVVAPPSAAPGATPTAQPTTPAVAANAAQPGEPGTPAGDPWAVYAGALRPEARQGVNFEGMTQYRMAVTLPADLRVVSGSANIHYTNRSKDTLDRIYLHLFPNLWRAGMTVADVQVDGQAGSTALQSENSLLEVRLPKALEPGQSTDVAARFTVPIPHNADVGNYGEFAYLDNVLALAQFYPTVAVYDGHWHTGTPASQGDVVFHDASLYDVSLTAPVTLTVAATGQTVDRRDNGNGTATWHLAGGPMRDFNIVASDRYRETSNQVDGVTVNSYFLPEDASGGPDALTFASDALTRYQADFGLYPYSELDVVETSTKALGIEYPGLIVLARHGQYDGTGQRDLLQATAAHEVAHQWWYNVVGDDQVNTPWMDEALAQYSTYLYFKDRFGDQGAQALADNFKGRWDRTKDADIAIGLPVAAYRGPEYSSIVYGRGPLFFIALQDRLGEAKMLEFLKEYYRQYQWKIASPAELQDLLETVAGQDLSDLFNQWVYPKK